MTLDSAQARLIAAQPRITPEERDQLISLLAEGKKPAELAVQFNKAAGTIANFQTRNKGDSAEAVAEDLLTRTRARNTARSPLIISPPKQPRFRTIQGSPSGARLGARGRRSIRSDHVSNG